VTVTVRRRWVLLCAIGVPVLALHGAVLLVLGPAWFEIEGVPAVFVQAVQARSVATVPRPATTPLPVTPKADERKAPAPRVARVALREAPAPAPAATASAAASAPTAEAPTSTASALIEVPVYATRLPPAGLWRYRLQRGLAVGEADLRWQLLADAGYELQLEGRVAGVTLLDWVSQGRIDAASMAPERFAVRRRGRDRQAANFQPTPARSPSPARRTNCRCCPARRTA
jgi:hypothetical protein